MAISQVKFEKLLRTVASLDSEAIKQRQEINQVEDENKFF